MKRLISINSLGRLTLPKEMRQKLGLESGGQIVATETDDGILLNKTATFPTELYSAKRLSEFTRHNEKALKSFCFKKK